MTRIEELLQEKRMSVYKDFVENRLDCIYDMIKTYFNNDFVMAEIGCFEGVSSEMFALNVKRLYCIDAWDLIDGYQEFNRKVLTDAEVKCRQRLSSYSNVKIIKNLSETAVNLFEDNSLDAVYIDGAHQTPEATKDIMLWSKKVKPNGFITGHDYNYDNIIKVVDSTLGVPMKSWPDGSWICKNTLNKGE